MTFKLRETYHYYYLLFFSLVIIVSAAGFYYYNYVQNKVKNEAYSNLSTLAKLKIKEIVKWREDRISEAQFIQLNTQFKELIHGFIKDPQLNTLKKDIVEWLNPIKENHEYINISIIADTGKVYSLFKDNDSLNNHDKLLIRRCIDRKEIILGGFYKNPIENEIALGCFIPLFLKDKPDENFGVLELKIDPRENLYPLIEINPITYKSAESFLVSQYQDSVIFLNDLKFRKNAALSFKLPLSANNLPAAMAVKGKEGIYQGIDYTGTEVLADLNKIPDSEWFIVSKVNLDEVYAPIREQALYILFGVLTLILLSGAIVFIAWKNEKIRSFSRQLHLEQQAERALRESEKLLKTTQEISHLGSWQLDLINNKLTWSDEVYKIFGLKPQEFSATYEAFLEAVHPEDRKAVDDAYSGSIRDDKESYEIEHRVIRRATGEIRFVSEKCEHLKDTSGKIFLSIGMVHDITEQKRIANELNEALSLHKTISSTVPFGMQIVDKTGMILFANESIIKLASENIKGQKCWEIYKDDKKKCSDCPLSNPRPVGTTTMIEVDGVLGGRIFEIYHTEMIYKGKPALLEIFQDITSRKKAEEALRLSEQSFRHLADSMPQLVWTTDPDGTVDYYNSQVVEFEGITKNEDGSWAWSPVLHEDDIQPTVDAWNNSVKTSSNYEIIHRVKKKNGQLKWFLSRAYPVKDLKGKIIKWFGTSTDINEQKKTEEELELALLELKRSNKELDQFAYTASHDLQEPIRMVRSYAQILSMNNKEILNSTDIENLDFIIEGAARMQDLINDLLKYSRVTTTKKTFELVDCNIILKDVLNDLKLRIEEENALIEIDELPVIKGDKTQIRQVFQNLIQNAVKFRGKNNPEIKIGCEKKKGRWIFSIKDNGIGIDPKFHDKIFVIFHRLHNREKYPGTGIGLSICKKIVELHGGQMYLESELNKGTTFYFTIPVK